MSDTPEKIEQLIVATDDPKDKAVLLILLEMGKSLSENTKLTKELHGEFREHAKEEVALIIKGRFLWRVLLTAALAAQGVLGWYFTRHLDAFEKLQIRVAEMSLAIATHQETHRQAERFADMKGMGP